jgi:hypothetical protein
VVAPLRDPVSLLFGCVVALLLFALSVALPPRRVARRLLRTLAGRPVRWRLSEEGVRSAGGLGESYVEWDRVERAVLRRDLLILRLKASRLAAGVLVGPLTPMERERVLGWVEAGSGKRVRGAR